VCRSAQMVTSLYKAYVRPLMESAVQCWNPWLRQDIDHLEKVQRRATKLVSGCRTMTYADRLRVCGLTTLEERRTRGDMVECFKMLNGFTNIERESLFHFSCERHQLNTRGAAQELLVPERTTLEVRKRFFANRVVGTWNSLPHEVRSAPSVNSFKNRYDLHHNSTMS